MHRFFIPPENIQNGSVSFPVAIARQMASVLRLSPGDAVIVLDGSGVEFVVLLDEVSTKIACGSIRSSNPNLAEPNIHLDLAFSLTRREKVEWILQKGTEIGVTSFLPFISSRSLVQKGENEQKKNERWMDIIREAAEQCGRGMLPNLSMPQKLETVLQTARQNQTSVYILWEEAIEPALLRVIRELRGNNVVSPARISLFIGPEGGFSSEEVQLACRNGAIPVSLGRRILRMETAAIVAAALVIAEIENN